ncbi:hypothetical protein K470DRAFT_262895 [Piedraia hortae CBS 480.64]|uniref:Uncharacterized protein n=1 Tax=Piedraia hortae CBS 480.64 TaxID=1314780 RepID=A0A6A7C446_9PEZI|nr:hypothetical protein K470DRAFT_262895 [Piedraia hortae CBS 480.64]
MCAVQTWAFTLGTFYASQGRLSGWNQSLVELWCSLSELSNLIYDPISHLGDWSEKVISAARELLKGLVTIFGFQIISNKNKRYVLFHIPLLARLYGPVIGASAQRPESGNKNVPAIVRHTSMHSTSRDVAN